MQSGVADLVPSDSQMLQVRQSGEIIETVIGDLRESRVEPAQRRERRDVLETGVGDFRPADVQPFELLPTLQVRQSLIGNVLGITEIQFRDPLQRLQLLHAEIGDVSVGEVELLQVAQLVEGAQVRIGHPARPQVDRDHVPRRVFGDVSALSFHPGSELGVRIDGKKSKQNNQHD